MSAPAFAVRFIPDTGGSAIPLDAWAAALVEVSQGLDSLAHVLAPRLAAQYNLTASEVREYLRPAAMPLRKGSNLVPLVLGAQSPVLFSSDQVAKRFWRNSGAVLKGAARERVGRTDVPASCAEKFIRASRITREAHATLQLVEERANRNDWRPTVDLTRIEDGLGRYAERRSTRRTVETVLIGRVRAIFWEPPGMQLELASGGTRALTISAQQRQNAHDAWGEEVAVRVEASMTLEGELRDAPRVLAIRRAVHVGDLLKDFDRSFGAGKDVWGTKEAEEYLKGLLGDS